MPYLQVGTVTAPLRLQPGFIMIGAQRCGATSLFRALMAHPQVVRPAFHKGVNYFDLNYYRGLTWYRVISRWPESSRPPPPPWCPDGFEASGYYLYHPFAVERSPVTCPTSNSS